MAYLKFSRDRRGYEHFYLVQPTNRGKARPRMLYWFRTPPGVKIGRSPFDPDMRRALEAQNPDVVFDWEAIIHTPIPPVVEPERWRERRRVERASRAAELEEFASLLAEGEPPAARSDVLDVMIVGAIEGPTAVEAELNQTVEADRASNLTVASKSSAAAIGQSSQGAQDSQISKDSEISQDAQGSRDSQSPAAGAARRGQNRRRRRRGRRGPQVPGSGLQVQGSEVPGSGAESSTTGEPAVQNSGEPGDENGER